MVRSHLVYCTTIWLLYLRKCAAKSYKAVTWHHILEVWWQIRIGLPRTNSIIKTTSKMRSYWDFQDYQGALWCSSWFMVWTGILDKGCRRGHDQKLFNIRFRLDSRKYVFSNRVVDDWNYNFLSTVSILTLLTRLKCICLVWCKIWSREVLSLILW